MVVAWERFKAKGYYRGSIEWEVVVARVGNGGKVAAKVE